MFISCTYSLRLRFDSLTLIIRGSVVSESLARFLIKVGSCIRLLTRYVRQITQIDLHRRPARVVQDEMTRGAENCRWQLSFRPRNIYI